MCQAPKRRRGLSLPPVTVQLVQGHQCQESLATCGRKHHRTWRTGSGSREELLFYSDHERCSDKERRRSPSPGDRMSQNTQGHAEGSKSSRWLEWPAQERSQRKIRLHMEAEATSAGPCVPHSGLSSLSCEQMEAFSF